MHWQASSQCIKNCSYKFSGGNNVFLNPLFLNSLFQAIKHKDVNWCYSDRVTCYNAYTSCECASEPQAARAQQASNGPSCVRRRLATLMARRRCSHFGLYLLRRQYVRSSCLRLRMLRSIDAALFCNRVRIFFWVKKQLFVYLTVPFNLKFSQQRMCMN